ncbi:RNA-directed DNA polymerase [Serratia marcescens]|uniref:retron St85 family RNA-directed DNA polymerase n=1 Tax=Serratia TaxID=613 RepID=UPI0010C5AD83|nr:RNA-dependent DNA polymerase [Serratia marcescens]MBH2723635.1 RNA-directed DNA polymerase [Serratia marcescens]MBH2814126.1 RNA-directed DNA polymerase [Serratia marcescens]BEO32394.1 RNA-directed DNA polymerase [Serratia marcescens]HEI9782065.1 retron St85 family RNA-directed DNA polymerase [Serratia marcescens]
MSNNPKSFRKLLQSTLFLSDELINTFIATSPYRYKIYDIAKRNSDEMRRIAHPSKELKFIQRIIVKELSDLLPIHECAYAYRPGRGIKENALFHSKNSYLLKLDLSNFFNSLTPKIFFSECKRNNIFFDEDDTSIISNCLFYREHRKASLKLSVGAPSSPFISNAIMYSFDKRIEEVCNNKGVSFTRYADDMTFSTNTKNVLVGFDRIVKEVLFDIFKDAIFLNNDKTIFSSKAHNRHITGVTISNDDNISLGRDRKRYISSAIHHFSLDKLSENEIEKLKGLLAFAEHIEHSFVDRMVKKYGSDVMKKLKKTDK